jgi:hypothetical protein
MCTYQTELIALAGSGRGRDGWFPLTDASVYVDHPVHFPAGHALMIDFRNPSRGAGARVAVELDAASARALAESILASLEAVPPGLLPDRVAAGDGDPGAA